MSKQRYFFLILILGSLAALGPFTIDMYLPGFPAIAKDLNTTAARVALTLSSYFIGISVGQLLYGPLLDRYGRKKPLYAGLAVYIATSAACAAAQSVDSLIALRFFQAVGSCAASVAAMAMVRDLFPVTDSAKVFALILLVVGLSPMLAPTAGSYVTDAYGWQGVFLTLCGMGVALLLACLLWLPESYTPNPALSLRPRPILASFWEVLREPAFYTYTFTGALSFCGLFAYIADSPLVFMDIFGVDKQVFGWIFAILSAGLIGSSQINSVLLRRFSSEQLVFAALCCQVVTGLLFLALTVTGQLGLYGTVGLLFIFLCCLGFSSPNTAALSLAPFPTKAGSASSLMGAIRMGIGALSAAAVSLFNNHTAVPMVAIMAVTSVLALGTLLIGRRHVEPVMAAAGGAPEPA